MAQVIIDIPDANIADVRDSLAIRWGYNAATDGTKVAFLKARLAAWVKAEYKAQKQADAAQIALNDAGTLANNVSIT